MTNNFILVDSCIWINYFRNRDKVLADAVDVLIANDAVALCGMVELEILQGIKPKERKNIKSLFQALHYLETKRDDFILAGENLNTLRSQGITIPTTNSLIAAICLNRDLALFSIDKDFNHFSKLKRYTIATHD